MGKSRTVKRGGFYAGDTEASVIELSVIVSPLTNGFDDSRKERPTV